MEIGYKTSAPMSRKLSANITQNHSKYWAKDLIELASSHKRCLLEPPALFVINEATEYTDNRNEDYVAGENDCWNSYVFLPVHFASLQPPSLIDLSPPPAPINFQETWAD
jgi:hypothetical protein